MVPEANLGDREETRPTSTATAPSALAGVIDFDLSELGDLVASTLGEPLVGAGGIVEDVAPGCVCGGHSDTP